MAWKIQDLIDIEQFQRLQDRLNEIYSFPSAIIDNDGKILTATAWQDVCTKFHRQNSECEKACIQSDQYIASHLHEANPAVSYRCPHGLIDNATPIIIEGVHYGNYFTGQFFLEPPDLNLFRAKAKRYGFDEEAYIEAVRRVPIWTQAQLDSYLFFIKGLIEVIAEIGLKNLKGIETRNRIQESEEWVRTILQTAMDGFWLVDTQGRLLEANETYCRMSGYSVQELVTMRIPDLEIAESADDTSTHIQKVMAQGEDRFESRHRRKDGSIFDVEVSVQYRPTNGGRLVAFLRDITDRKRGEEALRESEKLLRNIIDSSTDYIYVKDRQLRTVVCNEIFASALGKKPADLIGKTDIENGWAPEFVKGDPAKGLRGFEQDDIRALSGQAVHTVDEPGNVSDIVRMFDTIKQPLCDDTGEVIGVLGISRDITAHRRAEQDYMMLFREMLDGFALHEIICDEHGNPADYRFLTVNPAFERITGLKAEELAGRTVLGVMPGTEQQWIETYGKVALTGKPVFFENYSAELKKHFEVTAFRPAPNQFACIFADITERKKAEEVLHAKEVQLSNALEIAHLGHWEYDVATDLFTFNDHFYKIFRTTVEQVGSYTMRSTEYAQRFVHPEDAYLVAKETQKAIETSDPSFSQQVEHRIRYADGTVGYISVRFFVVKDSEGRTIKTYGVNQDITERKQVEEEIRRRDAKYRELVEHAQDGIFTITMQGQFLFVNTKFCQMLGYTREECLRRNILDTYPDDIRPVGTQRLADLQSGKALRFERPMKRQDGGIVFVEAFAWKDSDGNMQAIVRDITDRKQAEEEKAKLQDQLLQSQKMESVGRLAGGVAHDFNNMLGVILGHAEMAMEQVDPTQPIRADLQEIRKAAERSSDLTRQLLAFARKQTIFPKVLDLNKAIEGMIKMLQRLIGEDIHLNWQPGVGVWPVKMDPSQIDQILVNLSVNSRDAIAGVGKVSIETGNVALDEAYCADHAGFAPGDYVLLALSDDGCGMDKEVLGKLFEPFFTTKEVGKGTGLGLAMVYGIVKQNKGLIDVCSEPDQGTTFRIYLPRHIGRAAQAGIEGRQEPVMRGRETLLVVEDEKALLDMSKRMLDKQGYRVLTAGTPGEAIRLAEEYPGEIHLLMTDVVMPEMNGRDLAKKVLSLYPNLKRLFMSGYTADIIAHHGVLDEGVHFIQKPFSGKDLAAKVREALEAD